jgi:hypothetical protein
MKCGILIGESQDELRKLEDEFKVAKQVFDRRKKELTAQITKLGEVTRTGYEDRAVDCQRRYEYNSNRVVEIRLDTLDEINNRLMNSVERQMYFNFTIVPPKDGNDDFNEGEQVEEVTNNEPKEVTEEAVKEAASFNDVEWKFKEEVATYKPRQLKKVLEEFTNTPQTPDAEMRLRVLRDEVNKSAGMAPNEFGVYKDFEQIEQLVKDEEDWRVCIQTLKTTVGWLYSYSFYSIHQLSGAKPMTAKEVYESQAQAIMCAAFELKKLNRKQNEWTKEQKKVAAQITLWTDELIAAQKERIVEEGGDKVDEKTDG